MIYNIWKAVVDNSPYPMPVKLSYTLFIAFFSDYRQNKKIYIDDNPKKTCYYHNQVLFFELP